MSERQPIRRALVSVYDKSGLDQLAKALIDAQVEVVSTGSTAKELASHGVTVTEVSEITGFPECLDGRVKTLHPKVHAGILADRRLTSHREQLTALEVKPFDLVVCNLYPFAETVAQGGDFDECIEKIDIGGPSMVRAAAKNHPSVAVVTDGSAVLGLGNIGPEAAMPVMEGKAALFKQFADIDAWPICLASQDTEEIIRAVEMIAPGFGGINLEDIAAPRCFEIERRLRESLDIPVFHDDQHGTAIIVGAAILNGLKVVGKDIKNCKLVVSGAGAAALACLDLIVDLGFPIENIYVTDLAGVVYRGRTELMDPDKERFAQDTPYRTLTEVIPDADIFLGLSAGGVLKPEMVAKMAPNPLILALAVQVQAIGKPELGDIVRGKPPREVDMYPALQRLLPWPNDIDAAAALRIVSVLCIVLCGRVRGRNVFEHDDGIAQPLIHGEAETSVQTEPSVQIEPLIAVVCLALSLQ